MTPRNTTGPRPSLQDRHVREEGTIHLTDIGGSGVVTLAQILGTAASLVGLHVRTLDQTGLAQKGGAVVSDIKITTKPTGQAGKAALEECDLYLGCDLLVTAEPGNLSGSAPARTVAVVSTSEVPTGAMVIDPNVSFPPSEPLKERIRAGARDTVFLDARGLADDLLGEDQFADLVLTGAAYQTGGLPIPAHATEEAITLNGVKAEANLKAFRLGRQAVADPEAFAALLHGRSAPARPGRRLSAAAHRVLASSGAAPGSELARLLEVRVPDLIAYQDVAHATRYLRFVERVRRIEDERVAGSTALAEDVHALVLEIASLPDMVRGYEETKMASVARYRARSEELVDRLHTPDRARD
ncbi:2-oxoacid:acceptor oxidoreductase family protein [Kitasatospora sp. NPDC056783]|uniref:2-oxoacid:acceptor oxidoreductase family protein n=1 Tax=Kitasatospora sp. NPDC056783 TaxID=3345943 RepID=UPI00368DC138